MSLQKFECLLRQEVRSGNVEITEKEIITEKPLTYENRQHFFTGNLQ